MPDTSRLVAARDKLNSDFGTLIKSASVDQSTVDKLAGETEALDAEVVAASTPNPPPIPIPLDFAAFDAAVAAFKADANLTQDAVNSVTSAIAAATV